MALNSGTRTQNAKYNFLSSLFSKILLVILTFISRKYFIIYIGEEYLGVSGLFTDILTLLSIADLGLNTAMNVNFYKPIAENDTKTIAALIHFYKKLYYIIALVVFIIGLCVVPFLSLIINTDEEIPDIALYYFIALINVVISYLYIYKSAIIHADQKGYITNGIMMFVNLLKTLLQIILILIFKNYVIYIIVDVVATLVNNVFASYTANKLYPFIKKKEILEKRKVKAITKDISAVFLYKIAWSLLNGTDHILISVLIGTSVVGLYSNYLAITNNLQTFISTVFISLTASVGNLVVSATKKRQYEIFKTMQMVSFWICGNVCICLLFLTQDFIQLWFGKEYLLDDSVLLCTILNVFFNTCMRPVWTFREGTGMYRQIKYVMLATSIINIILSIFLGRIFGVAGILIATIISKVFTYFWYEPYILIKSNFNESLGKYFLSYLFNFLLMMIIIVPIYNINQCFLQVSLCNWFAKAIICVCVVNVVYFIRYRKTKEFNEVIQRIQKK